MEGNKSNKQLSEIENTTKFQKSQDEVMKYKDYFKMVHKVAYDSKKETRFQNINS